VKINKTTILLTPFLILLSALSYSEGTYELNNKSSSNPNIYIESSPPGNNTGATDAGLKRITIFYVDILNENEKIDIYTSANDQNVDIAIWCEGNGPTNDYANDHTYAQKTYNVGNGNGFIDSWSDVVNAQSLSTRNITPIIFNPQTEGCGNGTYAIRFYGNGSSQTADAVEFMDLRVRSEMSTSIPDPNLSNSWRRWCERNNYIYSWCTITSIDEELKLGRVWSYHYSLITEGFSTSIYSTYYVVAGQPVLDYYSGYLWKVVNGGMQPYGFHVYANALGAYPQINHNKSVPNSVSPIMVPEYPIYLNYPEKSVVDPDVLPTITNLSFEANCNNDSPIGGEFSFNATDEWNYAFYIDENGDGEFFEDEAVIRGKTVNGLNLISWDGKFENGQVVPPEIELVLSLNIAAGEIHFPYYDVENRYVFDGPAITLQNAPETDRSKRYFWDDSDIGGDSSNYKGSLDKHTWGSDIGNEAIVDTWKNAINNTYEMQFIYGQSCLAEGYIRAEVYTDINHNGQLDNGDSIGSILSGDLSLYNIDEGTCEVVTTDNNGYLNKMVGYGNYKLIMNEPGGICRVSPEIEPGHIPTTEMEYEFYVSGITQTKFFGLFRGVTAEGEILNDNGQAGGAGAPTPGIANNANRETYETGFSNVVVSAENTFTQTVIDETVTNGDGYFKLWIPFNEPQVTITYNQPTGYISVNSHPGNSSSINYDYDKIDINFGSLQQNVQYIVFSDVKKMDWSQGEIRYGQRGSNVLLTNYLNTFSYTVNKYTIQNRSNDNPEWSIVLMNDDECNDVVENWNEVIVPAIGNTTHDWNNINESCIFSKIFIPATAAEGEEFSYDLCVEVTYHNTVVTEESCLTNKVTAISSSANIQIIKTADKTSAKPGEEITYTIELVNNGLDLAENIKVFDATPPYTKFVEASCASTANSNVSGCVYITSMTNLEGQIEWDLTGHLLPSESYTLFYKVKINP
jgi:uncharacterized repeat protein (TIGR01451 family)